MATLQTPEDLKYSQTDEWVRIQGDEATIGITDYAQHELGDVVYVELPWDEEGQRTLAVDGQFGDIESVKATSQLYSPVAGRVLRVNAALKEHPEIINADPYGDGWMLVIQLEGGADLGHLMDAAAYDQYNQDR